MLLHAYNKLSGRCPRIGVNSTYAAPPTTFQKIVMKQSIYSLFTLDEQERMSSALYLPNKNVFLYYSEIGWQFQLDHAAAAPRLSTDQSNSKRGRPKMKHFWLIGGFVWWDADLLRFGWSNVIYYFPFNSHFYNVRKLINQDRLLRIISNR